MRCAQDRVALIPVKPAPQGKSRLATVLDADGRAALIRWMLERVLKAVTPVLPDATYVVGADADLQRLARRYACRLLPELGRSHNATIARAMRVTAPAERWLIISADLPRLTSHDVRQVLRAGCDGAAVLAPAHDGVGTNALLLSGDAAITPQFGRNSLARHRARVAALGWRMREVRTVGLGADVDRPSDLADLLATLSDTESDQLVRRIRPRSRRRAAWLKVLGDSA